MTLGFDLDIVLIDLDFETGIDPVGNYPGSVPVGMSRDIDPVGNYLEIDLADMTLALTDLARTGPGRPLVLTLKIKNCRTSYLLYRLKISTLQQSLGIRLLL